MGIVLIFGPIFFLIFFFALHFIASLMGWPYGYWISVGTFIGGLVFIGVITAGVKRIGYGFSIVQSSEISIDKLQNSSPSQFTLDMLHAEYTSDVIAILNIDGQWVEVDKTRVGHSPNPVIVYRFTDSMGQTSFIATLDTDVRQVKSVFWNGSIEGIDHARELEVGNSRVRQAVRLSEGNIVIATSDVGDSWDNHVYLLNGSGKVLSTLYHGRDLHWRDRAQEASFYLDKEGLDVSYDRLDSSEYFVPFSLSKDSFLIALGTDTGEYDSFFSSQGYSLPRKTELHLINKAHPEGKYVARFLLKDGQPISLTEEEGIYTLQTIDARERDVVKTYYYTINVAPETGPNLFKSATVDGVVFSPISGTLLLKGEPAEGAVITRTLQWGDDEEHIDTFNVRAGGSFDIPVFNTPLSEHPLSVSMKSQRLDVEFKGIKKRIWHLSKSGYKLNDELGGTPRNLVCELNDEPARKDAPASILSTSCTWDSIEPNID